jgi:hypothetical protein
VNTRAMTRGLALVCALFPAPAVAQFVFFDGFDGNDLLPHWGQPPPSHWDYNVSNGMLNVTALHYPGVGANYAGISAIFAPMADFRVDVWMGWQGGVAPHRLAVQVLGPWPSTVIASFGYRDLGTGPELFAGAANQALFLPASASGFHRFSITRSGTQFDFFLDGSPLASFSSQHSIAAGGLGIEFLGPSGGHFGTFHVDRVQVVPGTGTWLVLPFVTALAARRRRHVHRISTIGVIRGDEL